MHASKRLPPYRLLLIDDDDEVRRLAARVFVTPMFLFEGSDGSFGVRECAKRFAPDVILIDLNLPAFDGDRVCDLLRPVCPAHTRFYAYSAACEEKLRATAQKRALHGYFSKSTPPFDVRHQIERAMAR